MSMTIRELKELIKDWPETNLDNGEDTEVWVTSGWCLSSPIVGYTALNPRNVEKGGSWSDILFQPATKFETPVVIKNLIEFKNGIKTIVTDWNERRIHLSTANQLLLDEIIKAVTKWTEK